MFKTLSDRGLKKYLEEISKYVILTAREEFELAKRIREKNDEAAKEKLICSNLWSIGTIIIIIMSTIPWQIPKGRIQ